MKCGCTANNVFPERFFLCVVRSLAVRVFPPLDDEPTTNNARNVCRLKTQTIKTQALSHTNDWAKHIYVVVLCFEIGSGI